MSFEVRSDASAAGTRLLLASACLLVSSLLWVLAVLLNFVGPVGPLTAGILSWMAMLLDLAGALVLALVYLDLASGVGGRPRTVRRGIAWAFLLWAGLSAYWRLVLPTVAESNAQDLFSGLLGGYPAGLGLARGSAGVLEEMFALWVAASVVFVGAHVLITFDYGRAEEEDWVRGLPVYAWLLGALLSLVGTVVIVAAFLPVLGGGVVGSSFDAGAILKLLIAPNIFISGYAASLRLGLDLTAAARKAAPDA